VPPEPLLSPIVHQPRAALPVLLSVPHSGRDYPAWLVALCSGGEPALRSLEDPLVDVLAAPALRRGFGAVIARSPRAAIDLNRAEDEIDPSVIDTGPLARLSPRARGGLGIVPGRTQAHGSLWVRPIRRDQLEERLDQAHRPYHAAVHQALARLHARFGCALLLDCHSMPAPPEGSAEVVVGDRFGRSAAPWVTAEAVRIAGASGYRVAVNEPFAGGHVVERHGDPAAGIHALQIELDRSCYLAGDPPEPGPGFDRAAALLCTLAASLGEALLGRRFAQAAE
jgi:N-formylglutamate amidohydrolase